MSTRLTEANLAEFRTWLGDAPPPLGIAVTGTQVSVGDSTGTAWVLSRASDLLPQILVALRDSERPVWASHASSAAMRLAETEPLNRLSWLRCASTAWGVTNPGQEHWAALSRSLRTTPAPSGAARTAVAAARLLAHLQWNTSNELRKAVLTATRQEQLWRPAAARGFRLDVATLHAQLAEKSDERRQWKLELGIDLLDTETDAGTARAHAWLSKHGITMTGRHGNPSLSRDDFVRATVPSDPDSQTAWDAFRKVRTLASHLGKLHELTAFERCGRIHPSISPFAQRSGRTSVTRPALQNITAASRPLLLAEPGHVLVSLDYAQVEPRVAAALSGDVNLAHDLAAGDLYEALAVRVQGEAARGDRDARALHKTAFLAILYGQGARSLGRSLGIDQVAAQTVIDSIWGAYPQLAAYTESLKRASAADALPMLASGRLVAQPKGSHAVLNAVVQATAADLFYAGVARVAAELGSEVLWLAVHDELVVHVPDAYADAAKAALDRLMPTVFNGVPITGVAEVLGTRWRKPA